MSTSEDVEKPEFVVFSSRKVAEAGITKAIRDGLINRGYTAISWTDNFFPDSATADEALRAFLKQLLCYDAAVLVLGDDDLRHDPLRPGGEQHVPRDNVIFELGACMSRLGPKKTFFVCPSAPPIILPSYFQDVVPRTYDANRASDDPEMAVASACDQITQEFSSFDPTNFFSDLPAGGLAYGYFHNFLVPTHNAFNAPDGPVLSEVTNPAAGSKSAGGSGRRKRKPKLNEGLGWTSDCGFRLRVILPDQPLDRDRVQRLLTTPGPIDLAAILGDGNASASASHKLEFVRLQISLLDGRNISIYAEQRTKLADPFHIVDVPTTLLTSREVIRQVETFWGAQSAPIEGKLIHREGLSFARALTRLIRQSTKTATIEIVAMADFLAAAFQS